MTRQCSVCEGDISERGPLAKTCSTACYQWSRKHPGRPRPDRRCSACGDSLEHLPPQARHCSRQCLRWARSHLGVRRTPETLRMAVEQRSQRISQAKLGHSVSAETRSKISAAVSVALLGRPVSESTRALIARAQTGELGAQWRGDGVRYGGAHKRHREALLSESGACQHCGSAERRPDVALRQEAPPERLVWDSTRRAWFSCSSDDYILLCRACHIAYDRTSDALARS